jgi:alpha-amylase
MNRRSIVLYLHAHQPYRIRHYSIFDIGANHQYFNDNRDGVDTNNRFIIEKIAEKSYRPMNRLLLQLAQEQPRFAFSLSITGLLLEQLEQWAPDVVEDFRRLAESGRMEIVGETYHHSLAFFYHRDEFEAQVERHKQKIQELFGQTPVVFRNTELAYNNELAAWAEQAGYRAVLAEGWDPILGWRSPNFIYRSAGTENLRLLLKNYKLSDDIAFRFANQDWEGWPLTAEKYVHWLDAVPADQPLVNLFMDYETFGEHQWEATGIFDFMRQLPKEFLKNERNDFLTLSQAAERYEPRDTIDVPHTITWADTDRDLSAWLGNPMQHEAVRNLYELAAAIRESGDDTLLEDWRKLQTSDHLYYMCTKWFNDGDVHAYFSPYDSPYEAFINFNNALHDLRFRLSKPDREI